MIRKIRKYGKITPIDVLIYKMDAASAISFGPLPFPFQKEVDPKGKTRYSVRDGGHFVHDSFVFPKLRLLKLLKKSGPAIGDCVTSSAYRGQSIYPAMINLIARELLDNGKDEVFIVVNRDNASSIRGIEKAGFRLFAKIRAKRFLMFYFDRKITMCEL